MFAEIHAADLQQFVPYLLAALLGYILSQKGVKLPGMGGAQAPPAGGFCPGCPRLQQSQPLQVQVDAPGHSVRVDGTNVQLTKKENQ